MIRLLAAIMCAIGARRWPRLWFVAASLVAECFTHELVACVGALAPMAWASSTIMTASVGASFGGSPRRTACVVAACYAIVTMILPSASWQLALVCGSSWLTYLMLLTRATPRNVEQCIIAVLLAGNATTAALTLAVGIDAAYASGVVDASNGVVYVTITGLVLWAIRSR